ncbi:MAG: CHC2 zinc finger domain-containing protein [Lachnospiraceae bacterium]
MNVFEAVKQSVTTRQAAEHYGIKVRRNGMACCPFHNDKNPSMKLDRRFHCFGCGADGDVIDFTAKLYGLELKEAAVKLADDFWIAYDNRGRVSLKESVRLKLAQEKQSRQEEKDCYRVLCDYLRSLYEWKERYAPKPEDTEWNPLFIEALQQTSYVEYVLDILLSGDAKEKELIVQEHGKEVKKFGKRLSEINRNRGRNNVTDIREYRTGRERGRSQGYAGAER